MHRDTRDRENLLQLLQCRISKSPEEIDAFTGANLPRASDGLDNVFNHNGPGSEVVKTAEAVGVGTVASKHTQPVSFGHSSGHQLTTPPYFLPNAEERKITAPAQRSSAVMMKDFGIPKQWSENSSAEAGGYSILGSEQQRLRSASDFPPGDGNQLCKNSLQVLQQPAQAPASAIVFKAAVDLPGGAIIPGAGAAVAPEEA